MRTPLLRSPRSVLAGLAGLAALALSTLPAGAQTIPPRDDLPPEIDFESIEPSAGWKVNNRITVTGDVSDDVGIRRVEYRIEGQGGQWKRATISSTDDGDTSAQLTATFFIQLRLSFTRFIRLHIRVIDTRGNESDHIVRRFRFDRYRKHQPVAEPDTGGNGGNGNQAGNGDGTNTGGDTNTGGNVGFIPGVGVVET
jgi:hypothetical protein